MPASTSITLTATRRSSPPNGPARLPSSRQLLGELSSKDVANSDVTSLLGRADEVIE
jgi:hypothetical protein